MLYGLCLELTDGGRGYLCQKDEWSATPDYPQVFREEAEAQTKAFNLIAKDADYFGRVSVVRLIPGVSRWFVEG
jgi:hypothetical protein